MTAHELSGSVAAMVAHARDTGGGRDTCCARGKCAMHLAELSPITTSTIHFGASIAVVPNYGTQELAVAYTKAAIESARARIW